MTVGDKGTNNDDVVVLGPGTDGDDVGLVTVSDDRITGVAVEVLGTRGGDDAGWVVTAGTGNAATAPMGGPVEDASWVDVARSVVGGLIPRNLFMPK